MRFNDTPHVPRAGAAAERLLCAFIYRAYPEEWVMSNFPKMTIKILEIAAVATPENLLWRFNQDGSRPNGLRYHLIELVLGADIVGERK